MDSGHLRPLGAVVAGVSLIMERLVQFSYNYQNDYVVVIKSSWQHPLVVLGIDSTILLSLLTIKASYLNTDIRLSD